LILLYQLFYNLINNSLKFASTNRQSQIHIDAEVAGQDELQKAGLNIDKPYTRIRVQDNGIGFDQQDADKIFQSFSRLHPKDRYEGTGLGLALCKNIVERHSGSITATGAYNEGAVFTLLLPLPDAGSSLVQTE
jgi:signal transduction histidine kinase